MFSRLGAWCCRRRGRVVVAWLVVLVGLGVVAGGVGPKFRTTFDLPNVESRQGFDILSEKFDGMGAGDNGTIVFQSANGFSPQEKKSVSVFLSKVGQLKNTSVADPFAEGGELQVSVQPGVEGTIAIAPIEVDRLDIKDREKWAEEVRSLAPRMAGLNTYFGGQMFDKVKAPSSRAGVAVQSALAQLGVPYQFARSSPGVAFDCSGLTKYAWAQAGVSLPHYSKAQYELGPRIPIQAVQPGDLIFSRTPIGHVAIYIGNGKMVHAPRRGDVVKVGAVPWERVVGITRPG